jgi:H+/gluconate symporter-like permease
MWSVLLLVASITLIVVLTTQVRLHPFAALPLVALFYGTLAGMSPTKIVVSGVGAQEAD